MERDIEDPTEVIRIARKHQTEKMEKEGAGVIAPSWETGIRGICIEATRSPKDWALCEFEALPEWLREAYGKTGFEPVSDQQHPEAESLDKSKSQ